MTMMRKQKLTHEMNGQLIICAQMTTLYAYSFDW